MTHTQRITANHAAKRMGHAHFSDFRAPEWTSAFEKYGLDKKRNTARRLQYRSTSEIIKKVPRERHGGRVHIAAGGKSRGTRGDGTRWGTMDVQQSTQSEQQSANTERSERAIPVPRQMISTPPAAKQTDGRTVGVICVYAPMCRRVDDYAKGQART